MAGAALIWSDSPALAASLPAANPAGDIASPEEGDEDEGVPYWPAPDPLEGVDLADLVPPPVLLDENGLPVEVEAPDPLAPSIPVAEATPQAWVAAGPPTVEANDIIQRAKDMLGIPYVWGGNTLQGLDCSAYVSRAWGLTRQTTDTLHLFSTVIAKDELLPGDILNLTKSDDPRGYGHVRLFDAWANEERTRMWVYEETPKASIHHVIAYDDRYTPRRRANFNSELTEAPMVPAPAKQLAAAGRDASPGRREARASSTPRAERLRDEVTERGSRRGRDRDREWEWRRATATPNAGPELARSVPTATPRATSTPGGGQVAGAWAAPTPTLSREAREPREERTSRRSRTPRSWSAPTSIPTIAAILATPTATPAPTLTATPTATSTPEPTSTPEVRKRRTSDAPGVRATSTPTGSRTATPAPKSRRSDSRRWWKPTATPTATATATAGVTPTATAEPTGTAEPTAAPEPTATEAATSTPEATATEAATAVSSTERQSEREPRQERSRTSKSKPKAERTQATTTPERQPRAAATPPAERTKAANTTKSSKGSTDGSGKRGSSKGGGKRR